MHKLRKNRHYFNEITLFFVLFVFSSKSLSVDHVKFQRQQMSDKKSAHNMAVLKRALEITVTEYGPYKMEFVDLDMSVGRMLKSSNNGEIINTVIVPASAQWDNANIAIRVPVRLGLLSYRLLLVNKADLAKFAMVNNLEDLNKHTAGVVKGWVTTGIFKKVGIKLTETGHFEGIFLMLNKHRFDYIPRGIYEIYDELSTRQEKLEDIVVEKTLALYIPTSSYFYVSPTEPRLAKRIESGVQQLLANGELKKLLYTYYATDIRRANLENRKIIEIENLYHNAKDKNNEQHFLLKR